MKPVTSSQGSRFFHAMVLMGGSLALACGGASKIGEKHDGEGTDGGDPDEGSGGTHAGGAGGVGGTFSTGGTSSPSGGGGGNNAGGVITTPATGGAFGSGLPTSCSPAQWTCSDDGRCSGEGLGVRLPTSCSCEASKPKTDADCGPNEQFVCRLAIEEPGGMSLPQPIAFDCRCVPADSDCHACIVAYGGNDRTYDCTKMPEGQPRDVFCGCALVYLR